MFNTEEIKSDMKRILEQPDPDKRLAVYYGIAMGFVNKLLDQQQNNDSLAQLKVISNLNAKKYLEEIVELTITNYDMLSKAFNDIIALRVPSTTHTNSEGQVYGSFIDSMGIVDTIGQNIIDKINNNLTEYSKAISVAQVYYATYFTIEENQNE